ncbi:MAG TPA: hypothetical protein VF469_01370 [Kofleriaceae bacterium]
MRTAGILAALALSFVAWKGDARADTGKAWTAAKAGLPAEAKFALGFDVAALAKTQLFATYYPKLKDKPDAAKVLDAVKDACKLDPVAIVQGVVVAMSADQQDGAAYVALSGIDKTKLSSCIQQVSQAQDKDAKVTVKQDGNITEISRGSETAFLGWVGKDVLVVSLHAQDKSTLTKWMGGKGALAKSDLGKLVAKVNTAAAIWGAGTGDKELEPGLTAKGLYGQVTYAKGNVSAELHAVMGSAAEATKMATTTNKQLDEAKQSGQLPPELAALAKAIGVSADKDQLRVTATMGEKDLLGALAIVIGGFGGP